MDPKTGQMPEVLQTPPLPNEKPHRKLPLFLALGCLLAVVILLGVYFLGSQGPSQTPSPAPTVSQETLSPTTTRATIPPPPMDEKTLSYTISDGTTYLQYRGKIWGGDKDLAPQEVSNDTLSNPTWQFVLQAPLNAQDDNFNEVFSFKPVPASQKFLFVMRWTVPAAPNTVKWEFPVYLFNPEISSKQLTKINLAPSTQASYEVPKIGKFSSDGKYVSFQMFQCWNCGGNSPETLLLNLQSGQSRRIGKTSSFTWGQNGGYTYTEYKPIPCDFDGPVECFEKPENLSEKTGQF